MIPEFSIGGESVDILIPCGNSIDQFRKFLFRNTGFSLEPCIDDIPFQHRTGRWESIGDTIHDKSLII